MTLSSPYGYEGLLVEVSDLLERGRANAGRAVNAVMTSTYWQVGRRIVDQEQGGTKRAGYGEAIIVRLAEDLTARFGRGLSRSNLAQMRQFYLAYSKKIQTVSGQLEAPAFTLSWSHYARLLLVPNANARRYYEKESIRGGWSVREMDRQISTQAYERLVGKRRKGTSKKGLDRAEAAIRDPFVLEFLNLRDEYAETELESALVLELERFLLELGNDFAFVARQRKLRIGTEWYRLDLLLFNRRLRCLVIIDLEVGKFTHADGGQMNMYLNYAREHWTMPEENPPVGLVLCSEQDAAVARYTLEGLPNKVLTREYKLALPQEKKLIRQIQESRQRLLQFEE